MATGYVSGLISMSWESKTDIAILVIDDIEKEDIARNQKKKQAERAPSPKVEPKIEPVRKEEPPKAAEQTTSTSRASFF